MSEQKTEQIASVAITATFTAEPLQPGLAYLLREAGLQLNLRFAPYHQVLQELISSSSTLSANPKGVNVVLIRFEDFVREIADPVRARTVIATTAEEIVEALGAFVPRCKVPTILAVLPASPAASGELLAAINAANERLRRRRPSCLDCRFCCLATSIWFRPMSATMPKATSLATSPSPKRTMPLSRSPSRARFMRSWSRIGRCWCWIAIIRFGAASWGRTGSTASRSLRLLRVCTRSRSRFRLRAGLICLASKNTERDVLEVFETRPDMVLKLEHIVAHRINWEAKPQNIIALANALNLGLESFVFIDDNPVECELMQAELPQVLTLLLPPEDQIELFLSQLWAFDKVTVTEEDTRRTNLYKEDAARKELEKAASNIVDFVSSLKVVVDIGSPDESEWPRLAQLTQRTNQFNFTTVRRTETELRALGCHAPGEQGSVLRVRVSDRFGDYGLVGLVIYQESPEIFWS